MLSRNQLAVLTVVFVAALQLHAWLKPDSPACIRAGDTLQVCVLSDMQKLARHEPPLVEHADFNISDSNVLRLHSARNETIAFQLLLH